MIAVLAAACLALAVLWWRERAERRKAQASLETTRAIIMRTCIQLLAHRHFKAFQGKRAFAQSVEEMERFCRYVPPELVVATAIGGGKPPMIKLVLVVLAISFCGCHTCRCIDPAKDPSSPHYDPHFQERK